MSDKELGKHRRLINHQGNHDNKQGGQRNKGKTGTKQGSEHRHNGEQKPFKIRFPDMGT